MPRLPDIQLKAKLFRGLADPSRLAVLEALRDGRRCVSDLVRRTALSQPNVSAHLACLQDCGLVSRARQGRFVFYEIAHKDAVVILEHAEAILGRVGDHVYRCTRYSAVHQSSDRPLRTAQSGGKADEGRRPAPLGRARGEGRAVARPDASARAFPANEAVRAKGSKNFRTASYELPRRARRR